MIASAASRRCVLLLSIYAWLSCAVGNAAPVAPLAIASLDRSEETLQGITAQRLALVINDADAYSVAVGDYYASRRHIPSQNIVHVKFTPGRSAITASEFEALRAAVIARTPTRVQAFALAWVEPYRVDCMSITSAFAFGFSTEYCAEGCHLTRPNAYFNAHTRLPADALGVFPTVSLAAFDVGQAKALIDRGVASDGSWPAATAYLVSSDDAARNVRARNYENAKALDSGPISLAMVSLSTMHNRNDVMFYFVGARVVDDMTSNRFVSGAIADHLTSTGGDLLHTRQMSSLHWIRAGATGSYGTVVEPCAFVEKFPDPAVMMRFYLAGESLIEAYWKSVAMPGQGIFIGEPLARPFAKPKREGE